MAQLKDLIVSGSARIIGTMYVKELQADEYKGTAEKATSDSLGNDLTRYINDLTIDNRTITFKRGDGTRGTITTPDFTINEATDVTSGTTKVYNTTGSNLDGTMSQSAITSALNAKLDDSDVLGTTGESTTRTMSQKAITDALGTKLNATATAVAATKDGSDQNIASTYVKGVDISGRTITITKGDGSSSTLVTQDTNTTYNTATSSAEGLVKLYNTSGENTDGAMTQSAVNSAMLAMQQDFANRIAAIGSLNLSIVEELPESGANATIYLVPETPEQVNEKYIEYIWIPNVDEESSEDPGYFEKIGTSSADLSNYYTKTEVQNLLASTTVASATTATTATALASSTNNALGENALLDFGSLDDE